MQKAAPGRLATRHVSHAIGFQQRGLYCQSLPDGSERWTAEDEHGRELADAMVYTRRDEAAVIDYLGRIAYGDDIDAWQRPALSVILGDASRPRSPAASPDAAPADPSPQPRSQTALAVIRDSRPRSEGRAR